MPLPVSTARRYVGTPLILLTASMLTIAIQGCGVVKGKDQVEGVTPDELSTLKLGVRYFEPSQVASAAPETKCRIRCHFENNARLEVPRIVVKFTLSSMEGAPYEKSITLDHFKSENMEWEGAALPFMKGDFYADVMLPSDAVRSSAGYWMDLVSAECYRKPQDMSILSHWFTKLELAPEGDIAKDLERNPSLAVARDPAHGLTALHFVAMSDDLPTFQLLISKGADMHVATARSNLPIHYAALHGPTILGWLISQHENLEAQNVKSATPLIFAISGTNGDCIGELLDAGVDVNHLTEDGETGVSMAARCLNVHGVEQVVEHGGHVNFITDSGLTPLDCATVHNEAEVVEYLIQKGANLETRDPKWKATALHCAAQWGADKVVPVLLQAGADPNVKNVKGYTPLALCKVVAADPNNVPNHTAENYQRCIEMLEAVTKSTAVK
jgi:ankyrin repeat protein